MVKSVIFVALCAIVVYGSEAASVRKAGCEVPAKQFNCQTGRIKIDICASNGCRYDNYEALDCAKNLYPNIKQVEDESICGPLPGRVAPEDIPSPPAAQWPALQAPTTKAPGQFSQFNPSRFVPNISFKNFPYKFW